MGRCASLPRRCRLTGRAHSAPALDIDAIFDAAGDGVADFAFTFAGLFFFSPLPRITWLHGAHIALRWTAVEKTAFGRRQIAPMPCLPKRFRGCAHRLLASSGTQEIDGCATLLMSRLQQLDDIFHAFITAAFSSGHGVIAISLARWAFWRATSRHFGRTLRARRFLG